MIVIDDLHVETGDRKILNGVSLALNRGEVHAVMGPNGSGKSTLSYVLAGRDGYRVTKGTVKFEGRDLLAMSPEDRAAAGLFLAFQYPVEIPGVQMSVFLRTMVNAVRKRRGEAELDALDFLKLVKTRMKALGVADDMLKRAVNAGASGGEKKRNEVLQMVLLEPRFAVMDETDSGLDIDALKVVAQGINSLRSPERSFLLITHYQRLLDYVKPDVVHILAEGRIVKTGGPELALELEKKGYAGFTGQAA